MMMSDCIVFLLWKNCERLAVDLIDAEAALDTKNLQRALYYDCFEPKRELFF